MDPMPLERPADDAPTGPSPLAIIAGIDLAQRLHATTDPQVWAAEFHDAMIVRSNGLPPVEVMTGWFANAIETGRQEGRRPDKRVAPAEVLNRLLGLLEDAPPGSHPAALLDSVARLLIDEGYGTTLVSPDNPDLLRFIGLTVE